MAAKKNRSLPELLAEAKDSDGATALVRLCRRASVRMQQLEDDLADAVGDSSTTIYWRRLSHTRQDLLDEIRQLLIENGIQLGDSGEDTVQALAVALTKFGKDRQRLDTADTTIELVIKRMSNRGMAHWAECKMLVSYLVRNADKPAKKK